MPHRFTSRILLAVSGKSPQILTETLYAVAVADKHSPFVPTEIHLITTLEGKSRAQLQLLNAKSGKFHEFCRDYGIEGMAFDDDHIHVIADKDGRLLDDIVTPEQNEAAANFITRMVSRLTQDENSAIHVSIAGGRKTMGYYLGYALSLYGRRQDRLSHVLVTDRYEGLPTFFYPTIESNVIYDRNNNPLDAKDAEVMLAEIPFVPLRAGIPELLLAGQAGFSETIDFLRNLEGEPHLVVTPSARLLAHGVKIEMTLVNVVFYLWLVQQTVLRGMPILRGYEAEHGCVEAFIALYNKMCGNSANDEADKTVKLLRKSGMEKPWISERISAIKKSFEAALGTRAARLYTVQGQGGNSFKTYALPLLKEQVHIAKNIAPWLAETEQRVVLK